jgi:hypothetical protein
MRGRFSIFLFPIREHKNGMLERIPRMFNWINITPQKMILLDMTPGRFPLRKTWSPDSATVQTPG